jgi:hypothetical protein
MIDTDKYEGVKGSLVHSISNEEWKKLSPAAQALIADAPLLLAEVIRLREELKQTRESLWWCYDNYRFDGHPMTDVDWNFIGNLLGADMESEEE